MNPVRIVIFAKAPLPGLAKTRLIPSLGRDGAADLAEHMLRHTIDQAKRANLGPVELCVAPDPTDPVWAQLALPSFLFFSAQGQGDLGERLARASQRITNKGETILLIGTDCPALTADKLRKADQALERYDSCLIPVSDGGYALLGMREHLAELFYNMPWSTDRVAELTRRRIQDKGWTLAELASLNDIDEPEDLQWLPSTWQRPGARYN